VAAGVTTYSINDTTSGAPVALVPPVTNVPYVSGQAISFNGIQFDIKGTPAAGDTFNVSPSSNQSIFDTLSKFITTLNAPIPAGNPAALAAYQQGLNAAISSLDHSLNNVLGVRATIGARLNELDALNVTGDSLGLQYKQTLSKIQDTDYTKAISDLTQQNMNLQAAQKSFAQVSGLSLFNYLK
jgi:flagellar hook-associated protein 3 FlgL